MARRSPRNKQALRALDAQVVDGLLTKLRARGEQALSTDDYDALTGVVETWAHLTEVAGSKAATITDIRRILGFQRQRTRSRKVPPPADPDGVGEDEDKASGENTTVGERDAEAGEGTDAPPASQDNRHEHGRSKADTFDKLREEHHVHTKLAPGDVCPDCSRGRLYKYRPSVFTTISGHSPLVATQHTQDCLQCNLCKTEFKAPLPARLELDGVSGTTRYTYSAVAMVGIYRFFAGQPMHRQESLQKALGVRVPDSSIWDLCERLADGVRPMRNHLLRLATNAKVFYGDDTGARILNARATVRNNRRTGEPVVRTGCHTTCLVALTADDHVVSYFRTGVHHTGEVMDLVLADRDASLAPPVFMGDCIASNTVTTSVVLYAGCNAHAVRRFKELAERYPEHTDFVLQRYRAIYDAEAACMTGGLSAEARRDHHARHSRPLLREICEYGEDLVERRVIEPNSDLGAAFGYVADNERRLAAFTRHPHAPLDNNRCERELRTCVRLRETGRFFRNEMTAHVADIVLTVGATAQAAGANLFDYFVALQRNRDEVLEHPEEWEPWRFTPQPTLLEEATAATARVTTGPPVKASRAHARVRSPRRTRAR